MHRTDGHAVEPELRAAVHALVEIQLGAMPPPWKHLSTRRIKVELVGSCVMQALDANPLGGNPSDAGGEASGAKRACA